MVVSDGMFVCGGVMGDREREKRERGRVRGKGKEGE